MLAPHQEGFSSTQSSELSKTRGRKKFLVFYPDHVSGAHLIEQADNFDIIHLHAATTLWRAQLIFMIGAVDIDVALVSIDFTAGVHPWFLSAQPENSRSDQILRVLFVVEFIEMFADIYSPFENRSRRRPGADFLRNAVQSAWRAEGVFRVGRRAQRCGNDMRAN